MNKQLEITDIVRDFLGKAQLSLAAINEETSIGMFKKLLIVSLIDSLSRVVADSKDGQKLRFTRFIADFSDWKDLNRVSAPHLYYLLKELKSRKYEDAREYTRELINSRSSIHPIVGIECDPTLAEVLQVWPELASKKVVGDLSLDAITHLPLFYACLLYTSPSPRDRTRSRMPSSA